MVKFSIGPEIGRGGFGTVHRAYGEDGVEYAVKLLNLAAFSPQEHDNLAKRFEREVRYQAAIDHPNVVRILESNLGANPPWFLMPLAEGSLEDDLRADRTLGGAPQRALVDILAGIEALHEKGFYHRDLKPANILKFRVSDGGIVYQVSDFGLTTPGAGQTTTLTISQMGGGTLSYRAPECAINFRRATIPADIYSIGAILHDIFGGGANRIPHSKLSVAGPLGPVVERCTETHPLRRFQSIAALREELFGILSASEISFDSQEEEEIVEILTSNRTLNSRQWDRVYNLIDENEENGRPNFKIFRYLSLEHVRQLASEAPDMFAALGAYYCKYAAKFNFDFDFSDIVSDKAEVFYELGDIALKAKVAVAVLELGTSHNRWRIERQFVRMAGPDVEDRIAERIRVEIEVQRYPFVRAVDHIERSIGVQPEALHPILNDYYLEMKR